MGVGGHCLHRDVLAEVLCQGPKEIYQMVPQGYPPGTCCTLRGSLHSHAPTCLPREAGRGSGSQWEPLLLWGHCSPKGAVGMPWSCYIALHSPQQPRLLAITQSCQTHPTVGPWLASAGKLASPLQDSSGVHCCPLQSLAPTPHHSPRQGRPVKAPNACPSVSVK